MGNIGHSMLEREEIRRILGKRSSRIYFIGIGGISMSSLAELCRFLGLCVSGSDIRESDVTHRLILEGIACNFTQIAENIRTAAPDMVVYSLSISADNAELSEAVSLKIPIISRAQLLGAIAEDYKTIIAVSGSHGKSTTVAMLHSVLCAASLSPTTLCGATLPSGESSVIGDISHLLIEACEYGRSFLLFKPHYQLFLNLELDHTDCYETLNDISEAFCEAAYNARSLVVVNADDENLSKLLPRMPRHTVAFSEKEGYTYRYSLFSENKRYGFMLYKGNTLVMKCRMSVIGKHNAQNAVAAAVLSDLLGISSAVVCDALAAFHGLNRRLELIGKRGSADIIYDYAHHPSEISAVLEALSGYGYKKIAVIFSPHTYSRTQAFFEDFAKALSASCAVFLTEIYPAREAPIPGITSSALVNEINRLGAPAQMYEKDVFLEYLDAEAPDCAVLMGAGDLSEQRNGILN